MPRPVHAAVKRTAAIITVLPASLLLAAQPAHVNSYDAALRARNYQEAERAANAALATNPHDPQALVAKVDAIVALAPATRIDEAVSLAEQCIAAQPHESRCQEALGTALGTKARDASPLSAMGYAGKIRDAFRRAIELDPRNFNARFSLLQYDLAAPRVAGGGVDKARALAAETAKLSADAGQLMQALIDLRGGDTQQAERLARTADVAAGDDLAEQRRDTLWSVGERYLAARQFADADGVFRTLRSDYPDSELGPFGLALSLQGQGKHADAIPLFEQAAARYPRADIYYRMGQSLQASGNRTGAVSAYEKALAMPPGLAKKQKADAEHRVKSLKE